MPNRTVSHRGPAAGKKAIVYDRDKTMMLVLTHLLDKLGFAVSMASSVENGLELIQSRKPQLLVWELAKHPEVDFHMLHDVRRMGPHMPYVILVSTPETLNDDAPIEVMRTGDVFMKPFEPGHLVRRIEWLVKHEKI